MNGVEPLDVRDTREMIKQRYDVKGAADYIGMSAAFLNRHRLTGFGPTFLKVGGRVYYLESDLDAWLNSRRRSSTSQVEAVAA